MTYDNGRLCGLVARVPTYSPRGPEFDFQRCQIFWEVVGLERGPLSRMSINEELLERKNSGSGLENRLTAVGNRRANHGTPLYQQKLALKFAQSGGR
jgi:hypothetical protein